MKLRLDSRVHGGIGMVMVFLTIVAMVAGMAACGDREYNLTISSTAGGSVTEPGEGQHTYREGTVVILRAEAEPGYRFVNWTGSVAHIDDVDSAMTTITMNGHYAAIAGFEAIPVVKYNLTISSTAGGSVTTPGEGTFTYDEGRLVDLVASPDSGCAFVGWTGDVGTIADVGAVATTITMNGDYSITANFDTDEEESVYFACPNLEEAIREVVGIPDEAIYPPDLEGLTDLDAVDRSIADLTGLEYCIDLEVLLLDGNQITGISPLSSLTKLAMLGLSFNQIMDISPLLDNDGLGKGNVIDLYGNPLGAGSVDTCIPQLRDRGVTVIYEQETTGTVTVVPCVEAMTAEYLITFEITGNLVPGIDLITIEFPEGTILPDTFDYGDITVNGDPVLPDEVLLDGTAVTFFVPQYVAPGTVTLVFHEEAGVVNPPAGWYVLKPMLLGPYQISSVS